jgi:hypothetical protein
MQFPMLRVYGAEHRRNRRKQKENKLTQPRRAGRRQPQTDEFGAMSHAVFIINHEKVKIVAYGMM